MVVNIRIEALDNRLDILRNRLSVWMEYNIQYPDSTIIKNTVKEIKDKIAESEELLKEELENQK